MNIRFRPWLAGALCVVALTPPGVGAQTRDDELDALRAEVAALRQQYETRVHDLETRIEQLEATQSA